MAESKKLSQDHPRFRLAKNLQLGLARQGIRASDLARRSGVAPSVLSEWSSGRIPRSIFNIAAVAKELNLSIEELCFGEPGVVEPLAFKSSEPSALIVRPGQVIRISVESEE